MVRINDIVHALRHFLDSPATDVFAILQDKLSILIFGTPFLERIHIELIVAHNIHVNMNGGYVVLVF